MDGNAWIGLIGALAGVIATGVIGISTAALTHRWQESARRRDRADRLGESRAALRREAYIRFLVATDELMDYLLALPPGTKDLKRNSDIRERLRTLRMAGDTQFAEYFGARLQVNLVAGKEVNSTFEEFVDWMNGQFAVAVSQADPLKSGAFNGMTEKRTQLVDVMRDEQENDLVERI